MVGAACALLSVARSTLGDVWTLLARDADVVPPMKALAAQYPRHGYRTIRIFLERDGHDLGVDLECRGRTARTNRSTGSCATSTSRCSGSEIEQTRRSASSSGGSTRTRSVRTRVSGT
jgi:hypothetical protein